MNVPNVPRQLRFLDDWEICTHCQKPAIGMAGIQRGERYFPLCHPDWELRERGVIDCYRQVVVWRHPIEDCRCLEEGWTNKDGELITMNPIDHYWPNRSE